MNCPRSLRVIRIWHWDQPDTLLSLTCVIKHITSSLNKKYIFFKCFNFRIDIGVKLCEKEFEIIFKDQDILELNEKISDLTEKNCEIKLLCKNVEWN